MVNAAPTALIRFSPASPYAGDVVDFASLSRDPDGYLASEAWDLDGDGQFDDARGRVASKAFSTLGAHTVRLRVVDSAGAGAVHAVTLNVRPRPVPPPPTPEQLDATVRISSRPGKGSTLITRLGVRTSRGAIGARHLQGQGLPARQGVQHALPRQGHAAALARAQAVGRQPHPHLRDRQGQGRVVHDAPDQAFQAALPKGPLPGARHHAHHALSLMRSARHRLIAVPLGLVLSLVFAGMASAEDFTIAPARVNPNQEITVTPVLTPAEVLLIGSLGFQFANEDPVMDNTAPFAGATHTYANAGPKTVTMRIEPLVGEARFIEKPFVVNAAPVGRFTRNITYPNVGQSVRFDAGTTTDDETLANSAYEWDFDNNGSLRAGRPGCPAHFRDARRQDRASARDRLA